MVTGCFANHSVLYLSAHEVSEENGVDEDKENVLDEPVEKCVQFQRKSQSADKVSRPSSTKQTGELESEFTRYSYIAKTWICIFWFVTRFTPLCPIF